MIYIFPRHPRAGGDPAASAALYALSMPSACQLWIPDDNALLRNASGMTVKVKGTKT
jgi:hypothetical protein